MDNNKNTEIASIIVGIDGKAGATKQTRYVRKPESNQSWLAWNNFDILDVPVKWIDDSVISLPRWRVQNVKINHLNGTIVNISREKYDDQMFNINNAVRVKHVDSKLLEMRRVLAYVP